MNRYVFLTSFLANDGYSAHKSDYFDGVNGISAYTSTETATLLLRYWEAPVDKSFFERFYQGIREPALLALKRH
jgi:hypothetical protein